MKSLITILLVFAIVLLGFGVRAIIQKRYVVGVLLIGVSLVIGMISIVSYIVYPETLPF